MDAYETRKRDWEDLDVTREELKNLTDCLKKEEFRKLLIEYAEEVNDPENKKIYEKEITQLEKERGVDVTFVHPEPGYVIKTSVNGDKKCFLNISKSDIVERPTSQPSYDQGQRCLQWSIPYTLIPPRDDLDKKHVRCMVFDVVFHPDTLYLASKNGRFRDMVNNTAMDGVESNFKVKLDRKNLKFPKISFKGVSHPSVIRTSSNEPTTKQIDLEPEIYQKLMTSYDESRERQFKKFEEKPQRPAPTVTYYNKKEVKPESKDSQYVTPKFAVKHQDDIDLQDFTNSKDAKMHAAMPKKLVVTIDLPLLKSANDASLDVQEQLLSLKSEKPAKYKLELPLPYRIDSDQGNAKFDPTLKKLIVTLPVIRSTPQTIDTKEDSGVDSDNGSPLPNMTNNIPEGSVFQEQESDSMSDLVTESEAKPLIEVIGESSEHKVECDDTALRTSESAAPADSFMLSSVKYSLPPFVCNTYDNELAITINVKNVDPASIRHRPLLNNSGVHILLTSLGAGFFPQYYSLCLKFGQSSVDTDSFTVETWDNNVVFVTKVKDAENLSHYYVGLDEEFMEERDLPTSASFNRRLQDLMESLGSEQEERKLEVHPEDDKLIISIRSNHDDSDDDEEHQNAPLPSPKKERKKTIVKARSISESSGDDLPSSNGSLGRSKGILKSRRIHDFSRSVSESSADENGIPISLTDVNYDSVQEGLSEWECSSLKKTVRFNDVVSRQLFRSNSSILGQRKKNQRKLRKKKRAHSRRMSESENSETEERDKYKVNHKNNPEPGSWDAVKPILNREKSLEQQGSGAVELETSKPTSSKVPSHKRKISTDEEPPPDTVTESAKVIEELTDKFTDLINATDINDISDLAKITDIADMGDITDISQLEFKNDLIFELEV